MSDIDDGDHDKKRARPEHDNHEEARKRKRDRIALEKILEQDGTIIYDVNIESKRTCAVGLWNNDDKKVKMIQIKGNFWKTFGYHDPDGHDYLHMEEALMLVEKAQLLIQDDVGARMSLKEFYEATLSCIELPCYLTYTKLKTLEYAVFRHNHHKPRCIHDIQELYDIMKTHDNILEQVIAYDMFVRNQHWSKKLSYGVKPVAHVIITTSRKVFPASMMLRLIDEAQGVPIMFAIVSSSSLNIIFEELCDANLFFQWDNPIAIENPLDFSSKGTVDQQMQAYHDKHTKKYGYRVPKPANHIDATINTSDAIAHNADHVQDDAGDNDDGNEDQDDGCDQDADDDGEIEHELVIDHSMMITDEDIAILADIAVRLTPLPEDNNYHHHNRMSS